MIADALSVKQDGLHRNIAVAWFAETVSSGNLAAGTSGSVSGDFCTSHYRIVAPLFDNLPQAKQSEDIKSMEQFDRGTGKYLVPYDIERRCKGILHIDEVHRLSWVFADGKLLGRQGPSSWWVNFTAERNLEKVRLDILVEGWDVNFDKSIHDRKGITNKVEVVSGEQVKELKAGKYTTCLLVLWICQPEELSGRQTELTDLGIL